MERLIPSKSGVPTAECGRLLLHSAYDPEKEAERFVKQLEVHADDVVLFLGSCLGYPERALSGLHPGIEILKVYFSDFFPVKSGEPSSFSWFPGSGESYASFLSRHIDESKFRRLRIVEWEPAERAYPETAGTISRETSRFCRELNGSLVTTGAFGRKWIRNGVRNFLFLDARLRLDRVDGPVFIAASGPSLEEACLFLKLRRDRFSVWALPSSLDCLLCAGIVPDLVVLTDPGHWASLHFHGAARKTTTHRPLRILMPVTAASCLRSRSFSVGFLDQGSWIERRLLVSIPGPDSLPPNGTVAGSAIELALRKTRFPVIVAGLDLACRGMQEHARPHAFDTLAETEADRLSGTESERFKRVATLYPERIGGESRTGRALATYAGWFASRKPAWRNRVYRFAEGPVDPGFELFDAAVAAALPQGPATEVWSETPIPSFAERKRLVLDLLEDTERGLLSCAGKGTEEFFLRLGGDRELSDFFLMADTAGYLNRKDATPERNSLEFLAFLKGDLARL